MSNMPNVNKRLIALRIRLELLKKVEKRATDNRRTTKDEIIEMLDEATRDVILNSHDYEEIAKEVRKNEEQRKNRN